MKIIKYIFATLFVIFLIIICGVFIKVVFELYKEKVNRKENIIKDNIIREKVEYINWEGKG